MCNTLAEIRQATGALLGGFVDVLVRVDYSALVRGYTEDGEVCEVAGAGPISPQAVYDIMDSGDPFLKAIVTKGKDVVGVTHLGRRPTHQQSALDWMFPTCAAEGCGTRAGFLQTDHREDWARTHVTVLDLLDRLCRFHHGLKTVQGWGLVEGKGKRAFVPPADPRHPRHTRRSPAGAGTAGSSRQPAPPTPPPGVDRPPGPGPAAAPPPAPPGPSATVDLATGPPHGSR